MAVRNLEGQGMIVQCPNCGQQVAVKGSGRPRLDIPVTAICDSLREHGSVLAAANELGCSRGYIYKVLKADGLKVKDVLG